MTRGQSISLVVSFCVLIGTPGAILAIGQAPQELPRVPTVAYPPFQASWRWPAAFDRYVSANFGLKRRLVQFRNAIGYLLLGDMQSSRVLAGRHGWLFLKQSRGWESFRSERPLKDKERRAWIDVLRRAKQELDARDIAFLYIVAPSKETIYPEYLPRSAVRARAETRLDEMLPLLSAAGIEHIDLRRPLLEAKSSAALYDKLDSHWNGRGALVASHAILERIAVLLGLDPEYARPETQLVPGRSHGDLMSMLALDEFIEEPSVQLVPSVSRAKRLMPNAKVVAPSRREQMRMLFEVRNATQLPKALILRDSFGTALMSVLSERFRRSLWVWTRNFDFRALDQERPNIVLFELTERSFYHDVPALRLPGSAEPPALDAVTDDRP